VTPFNAGRRAPWMARARAKNGGSSASWRKGERYELVCDGVRWRASARARERRAWARGAAGVVREEASKRRAWFVRAGSTLTDRHRRTFRVDNRLV